MRVRVLCAASVLWMAGCVQDPLAERSVYWGLSPFERPTGPLVPVLETDSATPAKQGLLYTSMRDAEIAATYSGRALARIDEPGETASALAEVVYAIAPAEAPAWDSQDRGFVPGGARHGFVPDWGSHGYGFAPNWASHGYGLQRALDRMASELVAVSDEGSAGLRQHVPRALGCTENTQDRAAQVLALSQQALAAGGEIAPVPSLEQIKQQAEALNRGVPAPGEGGCGLEEVKRQLDQVAPTARTS
jgi:hypothetical protein